MTLAFVFPGQGSQSVGMMNTLAADFPIVKQTFAEASEALGKDLWQLVEQGPEEKLNQTEITQPAMLAAGVATWRAWLAANGPRPQTMAGHSLGEYSALVCAEALGFAEAVKLVADRARFMQQAVPAGQGAMAAILGMDADAVRKLCEQAAQGEVLEAVNFNSPGQVVIAGAAAAVARAVEQSKAAGAKRAVPLPVSVPSHCRLMHPAAQQMAERLKQADIRRPQIPVIHNTHVQAESDPQAIRNALVRQIESPVRWVETIQKMAAAGVTRIVECGPGKVLAGLNKRIVKTVETLPVYDPATLREALNVVGKTE
ncbi:MAG: [acyl-carrier-protein] S-malonyltransferase [Candidatus Muproteobacteria bacterium RIFCSPHIGHO2_01_FULL_61_200]|uniref:Malonyl CoA-acyl carrier protein transacylase n=1 Tax=Candidatus Muproteobacteria bacterium RIFCSPLOWO2_01_FULL_60_18 TaxID=1817768 RepID=A0A1F6TYG8_9PROT|nr:MAG: [acyl-carrier-protein] S-malonyltransferase [Candidatus Muproteobacteria bacterium RIFCSPLOWO2_01_FULL_60_18]OGI53698.1 MAG: [acyl-carrier-protein] S-malonyltransferase [Candidatus Muproteobacteria bacterium RIFCSPHIGHO2_01_60_12]OGI58615.1 MAG: [acyl-carrier-protein] S-malonyltransferase [Candidatus Muproteobacteria bacterium RIFCSPHIGHO2_01_FULL_61_200]